jgi:hypothetical protein
VNKRILAMALLLGALIAPALTGCATTDAEAEGFAATAVTEGRTGSGTALGVQLTRVDVPNDSEHALRAPISEVRVSDLLVGDEITAEVARDNTFDEVPYDREDPFTAPEGEQFVVAQLAVDPAYAYGFAGQDSAIVQRVVVTTPGGEEVVHPLTQLVSGTTLVLRVPTDAAPESAVLEVESEGVVQQLSLLTGERLPSPVDYVYGSNNEVTLEGYRFESVEAQTGGVEHQISVESLTQVAVPFLPGYGWASEGNMWLVATFEVEHRARNTAADATWSSQDFPAGNGTTYFVRDDDGDELEPTVVRDDPNAPEVDIALFEVPVDAATLELGLDLHPYPAGGDVRAALESPEVVYDLTLTHREDTL